MTTINNRIRDIINKFYGGNATAFARIVNVGVSTIHSIIGKRQSSPTFTVISSIYESLYARGLSAHWLLTGEGEMIKKTENTNSNCLDLIMEKDKIIMEKDKMIMGLLKLL